MVCGEAGQNGQTAWQSVDRVLPFATDLATLQLQSIMVPGASQKEALQTWSTTHATSEFVLKVLYCHWAKKFYTRKDMEYTGF